MNFNEYMRGIDLNQKDSKAKGKSVKRHLAKESNLLKALNKKKENYLFESVNKTIKRIKEGGHDSRYD